MPRKLLIAATLAALVSAAVASAASGFPRRPRPQSVTTTELMPGVTYSREVEFTPGGPVVLDVVTAPQPDGTLYSLAPVLSNERLAGTERLTAMERRLRPTGTTVGLDGDYFDRRTGLPNGILMRAGVLDSAPMAGRSSIGISSQGTLQVARVALAGTWQASEGPRQLVLNPDRRGGRFALYTPAFARTTPREGHVAEAVISSFPPAVPGRPLVGTVTAVTSRGPVGIPRGGAVLVGRGSYAAQLRSEARVGQQIQVSLTLSPNWSGLASAIGGGPLLVSRGRPVFSAGEAFGPGLLGGRAARGAIGQLADGRILLVTVEGVSPAYSAGLSNYQLAVELARLGARTAVGLGAGPSAGLAFDGSLLTRPSAGRERGISDALVLSYSGAYALPPSTAVFSPNGDGVGDTETLAYRLARPSAVTVTLTGPGGTTIRLAGDSESPGLHTFTWNGSNGGTAAPEGGWTFTVTARDDRNVTTKDQRTFSLDDTLGSLTAALRGARRVAAAFELTRTADVLVRIERRNGVAVATLLRPGLKAGPHLVIWRGNSGGRRAPGGRYQVDVQATSSVGTSSLVAPFSLPSHRRK